MKKLVPEVKYEKNLKITKSNFGYYSFSKSLCCLGDHLYYPMSGSNYPDAIRAEHHYIATERGIVAVSYLYFRECGCTQTIVKFIANETLYSLLYEIKIDSFSLTRVIVEFFKKIDKLKTK